MLITFSNNQKKLLLFFSNTMCLGHMPAVSFLKTFVCINCFTVSTLVILAHISVKQVHTSKGGIEAERKCVELHIQQSLGAHISIHIFTRDYSEARSEKKGMLYQSPSTAFHSQTPVLTVYCDTAHMFLG